MQTNLLFGSKATCFKVFGPSETILCGFVWSKVQGCDASSLFVPLKFLVELYLLAECAGA